MNNMDKVKGLNDTYYVEGKYVRLNNKGIYFIPQPNRKVRAWMDARYKALDDRHWDSKIKLPDQKPS